MKFIMEPKHNYLQFIYSYKGSMHAVNLLNCI